ESHDAQTAAPPSSPAEPDKRTPKEAGAAESESHSSRIDKSVLSLPEPRRLRDKAHIRYVSKRPCLICGRQPSDPHHIRFAQQRALGRKVSDEFIVPLCARSTDPAMKSHGGGKQASTRSRPPTSFGEKRTR